MRGMLAGMVRARVLVARVAADRAALVAGSIDPRVRPDISEHHRLVCGRRLAGCQRWPGHPSRGR